MLAKIAKAFLNNNNMACIIFLLGLGTLGPLATPWKFVLVQVSVDGILAESAETGAESAETKINSL
jgi:hypothetical protein